MKSSILIVSYLWKDTWKRWCELPGSPAARLWITALLVVVATIILTAFQLVERSLQQRLERFGLDTLLVRQAVTPDSPRFVIQGREADEFAFLGDAGRKLRLRQLFARGQTEWGGQNLIVFTFSPEALPLLVEMLSTQAEAVCISDELPLNTKLRVRVNHRTFNACVARPPNWLRALCSDDFLLVPQGSLPDEEQSGWVETTVFQRGPTSPPMDRIIAAVNALASFNRRQSPQIQSALPLMRELEELRRRHQQWRAVLAGILGAAVALVYGAIAVLEFRQNLFVGALLRSFGAPARLLYFRHWLENAALANFASLGALFIVFLLQPVILESLGFTKAPPQETNGPAAMIFLWVNLGAFLSSLPVAAGLRQPVGEILS